MPPDVRDWLAPDHLAWFVIDAVKGMDLRAFYAAYRADGHGAAAYEPSVMVTVILFAFATGVRSSRAIERHCREHVAFRVITGNLVPDHVTVARFVCRHQQALSGLFTDVLKLCHEAGLVKRGVVSIDGTRIAGNANPDVNFHFEQIAREVLAEVKATDEAEDQELGEARGDELPEELRTADGRREFLRQARERLVGDDGGAEGVSEAAETGGEAGEETIGEREADARDEEPEDCASTEQSDGEVENEEPERRSTPEFEFDSSHIADAGGGRRRWLSEAKRQLEQHRWDNPAPISRSRVERLLLALERLEAELAAECAGNEAYEAYRQRGRMRDGRRFGRPPDPHLPPEVPEGKVNVTDPDSRPIPIGFGFVQGYNAQTAVNEHQVVLAAEITNLSTDFSQLSPMVAAVLRELGRAGIDQKLLDAVAADAGYWNEEHMDEVVANKHIAVLVAPDKGSRGTPRKGWTGGRYDWMRTVLGSDHGRERYKKRKQTTGPVFGNTKHNKGVIRFQRRGRIKVRMEWRLMMMTENLTKVHRHQIATKTA